MTQTMNLLHLAPDIQESLLFLPPVRGRDGCVSERDLRNVAARPRWCQQRIHVSRLGVRIELPRKDRSREATMSERWRATPGMSRHPTPTIPVKRSVRLTSM